MKLRASEYPRTYRVMASSATGKRPARVPASTTARYSGGIAFRSASRASIRLSPLPRRRPSVPAIRPRRPRTSRPASRSPRSSGTPARTNAAISSLSASNWSMEIGPIGFAFGSPCDIVRPNPLPCASDTCARLITSQLSETVKSTPRSRRFGVEVCRRRRCVGPRPGTSRRPRRRRRLAPSGGPSRPRRRSARASRTSALERMARPNSSDSGRSSSARTRRPR